MKPSDQILVIARAEIGYMGHGSRRDLEDPQGNGKAMYTKYARDLDDIQYFNGKKQGFDWCAVFIAWVYYKAFGRELSQRVLSYPERSCAAGVKWVYTYGKRAGRIVKNPQPGDIIILKSAQGQSWQHVGIVSAVTADRVATIEGNNGNRVREWGYDKDNPRIAGYLRPRWDLIEIEPERYTVKKGDTLWQISRRYYGSGFKYIAIMRANRLKSSRIHAGQILIIPDID